MLFNSLTFVVFFVVVVTLYWSIRSWNARKNLLVVASYLFYGAWNPPFAALLFSTTSMLVVGALQVIGGALLLIGRFVPLGLVLLGPVIVNILLFHAFLMPEGIAPGLVVATLFLFLLWRYREAFIPLFRP